MFTTGTFLYISNIFGQIIFIWDDTINISNFEQSSTTRRLTNAALENLFIVNNTLHNNVVSITRLVYLSKREILYLELNP
jgi:hypothetical protein